MGRKGLEDRVVCGREGERRGKERRGGRREGMNLSLSTTPHQLPCGAYTLRGYTLQPLSKHTTTQPLSIEPRPKMGDPHLLPTRGKGGKRGGKGHFLHILSSIFSLGENPQTPLLTGTRKKKTRKARARVNLTSRTKSIDLNETS